MQASRVSHIWALITAEQEGAGAFLAGDRTAFRPDLTVTVYLWSARSQRSVCLRVLVCLYK